MRKRYFLNIPLVIVVLVLVTSKIITYGVAKDYQKEINSLEPYANFNIENNDEKTVC
ncbi:hypothetical protein P9B03_17135 [Metasolibacillus meyeri]|uniref:Uncharacterized protein n=1 Tax=Metasolibacillus meyeri TaxID=1071052 RepID=A0AAW9NWA0_9BACL|nr:hypothetical protein [Metasolibacillus meyeri]MEC1180230.1 hypothetical protein [Metasolibacillus meyeri]